MVASVYERFGKGVLSLVGKERVVSGFSIG